jgi:predicted nucleic acid-binding protein
MRNINILNHTLLPVKNLKKAEVLCKSIDIEDTIFVAFAEFTKGKLWTGDMKLYNGLSSNGYKRLIKTEELYQDFIEREKLKK